MNCCYQNCNQPATCAPAVNVPAMNCPIPEHDPIRAVIGMPLCDEHLAELNPQEFVGDGSQLKQLVLLQALGKARPDFNRAFITRVELDSAEWKMLQSNRKSI